MKKISKIFFYIIFPFLSLFIFLLFLNILKLDWSYAHKIKSTYQEPFDWVSYKIKVKGVQS